MQISFNCRFAKMMRIGCILSSKSVGKQIGQLIILQTNKGWFPFLSLACSLVSRCIPKCVLSKWLQRAFNGAFYAFKQLMNFTPSKIKGGFFVSCSSFSCNYILFPYFTLSFTRLNFYSTILYLHVIHCLQGYPHKDNLKPYQQH